MGEAIDLFNLIRQSAAHDEPHDGFDTFGTGFSQPRRVVDFSYGGWIAGQRIEKPIVEREVDNAGSLTLKLVTEAAGAIDGD